MLVLLSRIDLEHFLLPDLLTLSVGIMALLVLPYDHAPALINHLIGGLVGYGVLWAIDTAYMHWRGHAGLGRGDAKLLGALGLWVGLTGLPSVLLIASLSGLCVALILSAMTRKTIERTTVIAFGPWLALGGWITWLHGPIPLFSIV